MAAGAGYGGSAGDGTTTGSGSAVLATSPTLVTPALGTPASGVLSNCTGIPVPGEAHTSGDTLTAAESGSFHTNRGAGGGVSLNLPAASAGLSFRFAVIAAQTLTIVANGTDTIQVGPTVSIAGGNISQNTSGRSIILDCDATGKWVATSQVGAWTVV